MAKNDNTKYWWIKLETDFFYQNAIDFLMSQKNGSNYVVLYQMLCLNTSNRHGRLESKIGDMIMKYDIQKIQRDTKYFDIDTIRVALELYKGLGLVYEEQGGTLKITNHEAMVGYQTGAAKRVAEARKNNGNKLGTNVPKSIELRVKSKDIKNKDIYPPLNPPREKSAVTKENDFSLNDSQFQDFWQTYPKHTGYEVAYKQFKKLNLDNDTFDTLICNLKKHCSSIEWQKENGRFIPAPARYLKEKKWNDQLTYQIEIEPIHIDPQMDKALDNVFKRIK
jgi:hypothetical protein